MANVKKMSDDELREKYDNSSSSVEAVAMCSEEINHRELMAALERINKSLEAINFNIVQTSGIGG